MFEHMMKRHNVLFVYVGGESPLKVSTIFAAKTSVKNYIYKAETLNIYFKIISSI